MTKLNFQKNKVFSGKTPFFLMDSFFLPIQFVLTLAADRAVFYGSVAFPIIVLSTKNWYWSFLIKAFHFEKT